VHRVAEPGGAPWETQRPFGDHVSSPVTNAPNGHARATTTAQEQPVVVRSDPRPTPGASPLLDRALLELKKVAVDGADGETMTAAARLLRATAVERRMRAPRTASVALLVSDAITYTPSKVIAENRQPLVTALRWLQEPFVPVEAEEAMFDTLLEAGWDITGGFDAARYADVDLGT